MSYWIKELVHEPQFGAIMHRFMGDVTVLIYAYVQSYPCTLPGAHEAAKER